MARKPNPNRPRYSAMIGEARRAKGWTQEDLARETNLEPTAIKKYEAGQRCPAFDVLYVICSVLGLDIYDVMDLDLRTGENLSNYHEYVDRPFNEFAKQIDKKISIASLADSGYTKGDISILYEGNNGKTYEGITTKTDFILKAAAIRQNLQEEYQKKFSAELSKLAINIAKGNTKTK